jgi:dTDP-4-amino-4,6-dideoxygalactose transaminase
MRYQLPAYSPVSLSAIVSAYLAPDRKRPQQLEQLLQTQFAANAAVLCGSGTQALQLALAAAQRRIGSVAVALPAFTCYDVATAAIGGAHPVVLYDVDPDTLSPDLTSLRSVLLGGARIVVIAPLYGIPVDWAAITRLAAEFGAVVIEDAAQGQGARYQGHLLGSLGDVSVLSFSRGKGWTGGGGGAVLFRGAWGDDDAHAISEGLQTAAHRAAAFIKLAAQWTLGRPQLYGLPTRLPWLGLAETRYREPEPPRLLSASAAHMLLATADVLEDEAATRRDNAAFYHAQMQAHPALQLVAIPPDSAPGYLRFPLRVLHGSAALPGSAAGLGILPSYPASLRTLPALAPLLQNADVDFPGADALVSQLVTLPTHSLVSSRDRGRVVELLTRPSTHEDAGRSHLESAQR